MNPEPENNALPLEELMLTPGWLKGPAQSFEHHSGEDRELRAGDRRDRRRTDDRRGPGKPRSLESSRPRSGSDRQYPPRRDDRHRPPFTIRRAEVAPKRPVAADLDAAFVPEEKGFAAMIAAMKASPRAYKLFDLAKLILNRPERHMVKLRRKTATADQAGTLFRVTPSETVCLSQAEAVRCVMRMHADRVFKTEKKPVEPPKGNFQFVSRCGITGEILGPPNFHEYQARIVRFHKRRLAHVPFAEFKAKIQAVRDEAIVKAWIDSMSFVTEYQCILDAEPRAFSTREELEKHFVENHLAAFITAAPEVTISGVASRQLSSAAIMEAVRQEWEAEMKFPLKTANALRSRLLHEGFHFFKRPKGISYVTRIRPKRFETLDHLTSRIQKIVVFLREHEGCTGQQLLAHLNAAPTEAVAAAPESVAPVAEPVSAVTAAPAELSLEQVLRDVHWLISEGYVVEFSDGRFWAPKEKPPEPPPKAAPVTVTPLDVATPVASPSETGGTASPAPGASPSESSGS